MRAATPTRWTQHLEFELDKEDFAISTDYSRDLSVGDLPTSRVRWADVAESSDGDISAEFETDHDEAWPLVKEMPGLTKRQRARMRLRKGVQK